MSDLSTNTRRDALPRYEIYNNGYAWVVVDRLVPGTGRGDVPAEYEHGKRGVNVSIHTTRETALAEARRLNGLTG